MDAGLLSLLTDTVTIAPWASQNAAGEATHGAAVNYAARIEFDLRKVQLVGILDGRIGQAAVAKAIVYLNGKPSIDLRDKLTLPDGRTPQILAVIAYNDIDGSGGYTTEVHC